MLSLDRPHLNVPTSVCTRACASVRMRYVHCKFTFPCRACTVFFPFSPSPLPLSLSLSLAIFSNYLNIEVIIMIIVLEYINLNTPKQLHSSSLYPLHTHHLVVHWHACVHMHARVYVCLYACARVHCALVCSCLGHIYPITCQMGEGLSGVACP
jgi:hypothetical protein